jgi:hypothetical protein
MNATASSISGAFCSGQSLFWWYQEGLRSYEDLLAWSGKVGTLRPTAAEGLLSVARSEPRRAERALDEARAVRAVADAALRPVAPEPLRALLEREREALTHARLEPGEGVFTWAWEDAGDLDAPLWPLTHAVVDVLAEGPLERLRGCGECPGSSSTAARTAAAGGAPWRSAGRA